MLITEICMQFIYSCKKMDWSQIIPKTAEFTQRHQSAIRRYTGDYLMMNAFLREEFWRKDAQSKESVYRSLPDEMIRATWQQFQRDPVMNSIDSIVQAAGLQEALVVASQTGSYVPTGNITYRSIHFLSEEFLNQALNTLIPDLDLSTLEIGTYRQCDDLPVFKSNSFISTSGEKKVVQNHNEDRPNFGGEWMMMFLFHGVQSNPSSILIDSFTDKEQYEVLYRIGLKWIINGIIKIRKGEYRLFIDIS